MAAVVDPPVLFQGVAKDSLAFRLMTQMVRSCPNKSLACEFLESKAVVTMLCASCRGGKKEPVSERISKE